MISDSLKKNSTLPYTAFSRWYKDENADGKYFSNKNMFVVSARGRGRSVFVGRGMKPLFYALAVQILKCKSVKTKGNLKNKQTVEGSKTEDCFESDQSRDETRVKHINS